MNISFYKTKSIISIFLIFLSFNFYIFTEVPKIGWKKDHNGNVLIYRSHSYLHFIGPTFIACLGIYLMFKNNSNQNIGMQIIHRLSGLGLASLSGYWLKLLYNRYCDIEKPVIILTKDNITYEGEGFLKYGISHIGGSMYERGSGTYAWKSIKKVIHFCRQVNSDNHVVNDDNYLEIITEHGAFRIFENDIQISLYELIELINDFHKIH